MNKLFILFAIIISLLLPFLVDAEITTDFSSININDGKLLFNDNVMLVGEQTQIILTNLVDTIGEWQELAQKAFKYTSSLWVELVEGVGNWWETTLIYQMWQNLFGDGFI